MTGALVGGPTTHAIFHAQHINMNPIEDRKFVQMTPHAVDLEDEVAVYHDSVHDFVTNEPAIAYTVKFLLLVAFYDGRNEGKG